MKMKVTELDGELLDLAVAQAEGLSAKLTDDGCWLHTRGTTHATQKYAPSEDWQWAGPIIEREKITLLDGGHYWQAYVRARFAFSQLDKYDAGADGDTQLQAAMRAFVLSKSGNEVDLP